MDDPTAVADVLERAADALFIYGRAKGAGQRTDGAMCVLGAIQHVQYRNPANWAYDMFSGSADRPANDAAALALSDYLVACAPALDDAATFSARSVYLWNDFTDDDEEVIDTIRRCAKSIRNEATR